MAVMCRTMLLAGALFVWFFHAVAVHAGEFSADENTLFLAHFNKAIDADFAKGDPKAAGEAKLDPHGRYGGALSAKNEAPDSRVFCPLGFAVKNNLNPQAGTLEMWIKTTYDSSKNPKNSAGYAFYFLFKIKTAGRVTDEKEFNKLLLSIREVNYAADSRVAMLATGSAPEFLEFYVGNQADIWTHYAITWENGTVALYINGNRVGTTLLRNANEMLYMNADANNDRFYIGGNVLDDFQSANPNTNANSLIDEVRISDIVRYRKNFTPDKD
jgi:hypothetical protein